MSIDFDIKEVFKRLGYPKHSAAIYSVLSKSTETLSVSVLASRGKVSRVVVYRVLEKLLNDSLVSKQDVGRRHYYQITTIHKLTELMRTTDCMTERMVKERVKVREKDVPQSTRFLYGPPGIRAAFDDVVSHTKKGDTFFRYTSEQDLDKVNSYLARDYRIRRDKKNLERMVISNITSGSQKKSRLERFIRYVPSEADQFDQNIIQLVYGHRVAIIDLTKEEVTIFENKQLADFQKIIFKLLYKRLDR